MRSVERSGTGVSDGKIGAISDHDIIIAQVRCMQREVTEVRSDMVRCTAI